jgi:hypothetical protein
MSWGLGVKEVLDLRLYCGNESVIHEHKWIALSNQDKRSGYRNSQRKWLRWLLRQIEAKALKGIVYGCRTKHASRIQYCMVRSKLGRLGRCSESLSLRRISHLAFEGTYIMIQCPLVLTQDAPRPVFFFCPKSATFDGSARLPP